MKKEIPVPSDKVDKQSYRIAFLTEGFRSDREESFTLVFKTFFSPLYSYSVRITDDSFAAEDIVQEAFVKIWERRTQFFQLAMLKSYLYITVRNDSLQWLRRENRKKSKETNSQKGSLTTNGVNWRT